MRYWLNIGHVQFDLLLSGTVEQVIGKMIHWDESGITILVEATGQIHSYSSSVVQHATPAP